MLPREKWTSHILSINVFACLMNISDAFWGLVQTPISGIVSDYHSLMHRIPPSNPAR